MSTLHLPSDWLSEHMMVNYEPLNLSKLVWPTIIGPFNVVSYLTRTLHISYPWSPWIANLKFKKWAKI
jgi:hypothetical protein